MRLTILFDNQSWAQGLKSSWGFSCLLETSQRNILFDTGSDGELLLTNMRKLGIDPRTIDMVFISHAHWDHTGGLYMLLQIQKVPVVIPASMSLSQPIPGVITVTNSTELYPGIYSTGELGGIEQSLLVETGSGLLAVVGCSHPGVGNILKKASEYGKVKYLVGGLHGFNEFRLLRELELICPVHCTQFREEIRLEYPERYVSGGVGKILKFK